MQNIVTGILSFCICSLRLCIDAVMMGEIFNIELCKTWIATRYFIYYGETQRYFVYRVFKTMTGKPSPIQHEASYPNSSGRSVAVSFSPIIEYDCLRIE